MSYHTQQPGQIIVFAKGRAESMFERATFSVSCSDTGPTGHDAKLNAASSMNALRQLIVEWSTRAKLDPTIKTTMVVEPFYLYPPDNRSEKTLGGYKATFTAEFVAGNVIEALALHDALTSIPRVAAQTPVFHVKDSNQVRDQAFKDAVLNANAKFNAQCAALGINPKLYEVSTWTIEDEQPRGKSISFKEGATPKSIETTPGAALLEIGVNFFFTKCGMEYHGGPVPC